MATGTMHALATFPARPKSERVALIEVERPRPKAGELLVAVREVGTDGTDREVIAGEHGTLPPGSDHMILGHENLAQVAALGAGVSGFAEGDWVVATVRRPDGCPNCERGESDMCLWGGYTERGISGAHGYLTELVADRAEFFVPVPARLRHVAALSEPLSINEKAVEQAWAIQRRMHWEPKVALVFGLGAIGILAAMLLRERGLEVYIYSRGSASMPKARLAQELGVTFIGTEDVPSALDLESHIGRVDFALEATGSAKVVTEALQIVQPNGVLCLLSVTGGAVREPLDVAALNRRLVLGNGTIFGCVNSNPHHFRLAVADLQRFEDRWPGFCARLISRRVPLARYAEGFAEQPDDIKVVFEVGG
jgi:glucose 1-dehydrogenase